MGVPRKSAFPFLRISDLWPYSQWPNSPRNGPSTDWKKRTNKGHEHKKIKKAEVISRQFPGSKIPFKKRRENNKQDNAMNTMVLTFPFKNLGMISYRALCHAGSMYCLDKTTLGNRADHKIKRAINLLDNIIPPQSNSTGVTIRKT